MTQHKFTCLYDAPILNRSGYGEWADALAKMLIQYPRFNTLCIPSAWGSCQKRQISSADDKIIYERIPKKFPIPQPHVYISHSLPHLSKPQGTIFNVSISAGLEVDQCPDKFMQGVNQWDLNITLSKFCKQVYENSKVKPVKPIEVLPWGVNTNIFKPTTTPNANVDEQLAHITEKEAFLFVGQHSLVYPFCDRKNIDTLVRLFCEAFTGQENKPALILKTSGTTFSTYDRNAHLERFQSIKQMVPGNDVNVYLLHGELSSEEMNALYNHPKVIASVSLTRGEGWGGPLLQASLSGKPVIAPNHSGHLDFLDGEKAILLDGELQVIPVQAENEFFLKGSKWFEVDHEKTKQVLKDFYYTNREEPNERAKMLATENARKFSLAAMQSQLYTILDKYLLG